MIDRLARALAGVGGEAVAAASGLVLLIDLFALKWYGFAGAVGPIAPRVARASSQTAWTALTQVRWLLVVAGGASILALLAQLALRPRGQNAGIPAVVLVLGIAATVALVDRVLISLPGHGTIADQKLGALIGLLAAVGIAYGGFESVRRARATAPRAERVPR